MNLNKLHDLNHELQAALRQEDLPRIEAALLNMMVANNDLRKLKHGAWLRENPRAKEKKHEKKADTFGPYTVPG